MIQVTHEYYIGAYFKKFLWTTKGDALIYCEEGTVRGLDSGLTLSPFVCYRGHKNH